MNGFYWVKMLKTAGKRERGKFYKVSYKEGSAILLSGAGDYYTEKEYQREKEKEESES